MLWSCGRCKFREILKGAVFAQKMFLNITFNFLYVLCTEAYVSDELFTSRAGVRLRIGNTDAEGRMAMADVLCEMKERVSHFLHCFIKASISLTFSPLYRPVPPALDSPFYRPLAPALDSHSQRPQTASTTSAITDSHHPTPFESVTYT